jgi:hypothetical protein
LPWGRRENSNRSSGDLYSAINDCKQLIYKGIFAVERPRNTANPTIRMIASVDQFLVFDPMRLIRIRPQAALSIRFVIGVIAFEPDGVTVALEGEDMGGDTVQEPAIV